MTPPRRLAAILAADVAGYSRLMGQDEAGTAQAVRESREAATPLVASHGGRIVKTMGDGVLLEFPSVVAAVDCAIAIQKLMTDRNAEVPEDKRIIYRIGVHLGDVLIAEPGGICLSAAAYEQVRDKLKEGFIDLGEKQLKNIARPMRVYSVEANPPTKAKPAPSAPVPEKSGPPRFSIVVLPFANLGGDSEQDYFVDGVTDSLTTDLSRIGGSLVIGRHTAFTYKGKAVDLKQIGRELNVRYVLEGSVQRGGNRMRVNVQLIDAETGNHLWAERFDKPLADLFDMQDEIVARISNSLSSQLVVVEARRAERVPNPDSIDLTFQGLAWLNKSITPGSLAEARRLFERALALDPANVLGLVGVAAADLTAAVSFIADDRAARLAAAEAALTKALSLAPENANAHMCLGVVQIHTNRASRGIAEFQRALELDRNLANAHGSLGNAKLLLGQAEDTETHVHEALRLSPRDRSLYLWCMFAGNAKLLLGKEEEAVTWLRRSIEANTNNPSSHFVLAAALARLGRLSEARSEAQAGFAINPNFTISRARDAASSDNATFLAQRERITDGLRKAGVPEQ
jgi:TolB-like protein